jgi:hypothetical protein
VDEKERRIIKNFKYAVLAAGGLFSFGKGLLPAFGGQVLFGLTFACWSMLPYVVYYIFAWRSDRAQMIELSGGLLVVMDLVANIFVFYFMQAKLGVTVLVFVPVWLTMFVLPAGYLVGWLAERMTVEKEGEKAP